jgi:gluconolactonase
MKEPKAACLRLAMCSLAAGVVWGFAVSALAAGARPAAELPETVADGAEATLVAKGFRFTEGPAWGPQGFLLFSDIPNNRIVQLGAGGAVSDFLNPSGRANGLAFDRDGRLWACQGGARRVVRIDLERRDTPEVIADSFEGKKLNSPNDLALDAHGGVYFTDPRYGEGEHLEQPVMGVYYVDLTGKMARVIDDLERPNGILVSPDGKHLYVAEPNQRELWRYPIAAPGKLGEKRLIFTGDPDLDGGGPDGMAHDERGNIYATYKGITVLSPEGRVLGRIPVPEHPANCTFGGKEGKTLYITARTGLYSVAMKVAGMALQPGGARISKGDAAPAAEAGGGKPAGTPAGTPAETSGGTSAGTRTESYGVLKLEVPASWKKKEATRPMRVGELEIPAVEGDAEPSEVVVFHFPRGVGGVEENVRRWIRQFGAEGRNVEVRSGKCPAGAYTLVDLRGTYNKPVGPPAAGQSQAVPGSRVVQVMISTDDGPFTLRLAGPEKTVSAALPAFRKAFGAEAAKETEEKVP